MTHASRHVGQSGEFMAVSQRYSERRFESRFIEVGKSTPRVAWMKLGHRQPTAQKNKPVTDRRLRPRCCHLESYFKRTKSSSARPLACKWHYRAQFIAKSKAACALRFSWAATSSNLGL